MNRAKSPVWAIVPASGIGNRMKSPVPKQYLELAGKPILGRTLSRLETHDEIQGIILVLNENDQSWAKLNYVSEKPLHIVSGGQERLYSVVNGLKHLLGMKLKSPLALIHDAVRPLVSHEDISTVISVAREQDAGALLAIPINDTVKRENESGNVDVTVPRSGLWRALTPQVFDATLLCEALEKAISNHVMVTDDASAMEYSGYSPRLVAGCADNIKITSPDDLILAELLLKGRI